jgi:hypothetical protein
MFVFVYLISINVLFGGTSRGSSRGTVTVDTGTVQFAPLAGDSNIEAQKERLLPFLVPLWSPASVNLKDLPIKLRCISKFKLKVCIVIELIKFLGWQKSTI